MIDLFTYENNIITPIKLSVLIELKLSNDIVFSFVCDPSENTSYMQLDENYPILSANFSDGERYGYITGGATEKEVLPAIRLVSEVIPNLCLVMWDGCSTRKHKILSEFDAKEEISYPTEGNGDVTIIKLYGSRKGLVKRKVSL